MILQITQTFANILILKEFKDEKIKKVYYNLLFPISYAFLLDFSSALFHLYNAKIYLSVQFCK